MVWLAEHSTRVRVQRFFLITYDMSRLAEQPKKWEEWRLLGARLSSNSKLSKQLQYLRIPSTKTAVVCSTRWRKL